MNPDSKIFARELSSILGELAILSERAELLKDNAVTDADKELSEKIYLSVDKTLDLALKLYCS